MPFNCPAGFYGHDGRYICDNACRYFHEDKCSYYPHNPPRSILEILTNEEMLGLLFQRIGALADGFNARAPSRVLSQMRRDLDDVKGQLINFQEKFNQHFDEGRKKKPKKPRGPVEL